MAKKANWVRSTQMVDRAGAQIDRLPAQDALFLADKKYSDMTKFLVLWAVANEKSMAQQEKRYARAKRILGTVAMASAAASASFASTHHTNLALLAGVVSFGAVGALLLEKSGRDGAKTAIMGNCIDLCKKAEQNSDLKSGLQKLAPNTLSFSSVAKTCPSSMYVLQWKSGETISWP